jgi:HPt (histidine-containing phosphotransfer) domain-containing protein
MLQDELRAVFLPRFLSAARERLGRAQAGDHSQAAAELHSLAGEAMLLGLKELSELATAGEEAARRCFSESDEVSRSRCAELIARMVEGIEGLSAAQKTGS